MARLARRNNAQLVIADANGLQFLEAEAGTGEATLLKLLDEKYLNGKEVTDFIEFEEDNFFVTVLNSNYFYIIRR